MDRRDAWTNRDVGYTTNIDAGEDEGRNDVVSCMTVNTEGERSFMLSDCEGVSRTADWYADQILATMDKTPGGRTSCFHVCIDAGTAGVHCSNPTKIQDTIRAKGCTWVTVTVCQFH